MGRGIPDRWLEYTKTGEPIKSADVSTRFISFKVPLKASLTQFISKEEVFTPSDLISLYNKKGIKLGLIIDLTFTSRYYEANEFTRAGIKHVKIPIEGHMVPKKARMETFAKTVKDFLKNCNDEDVVIGVHCTHGVNRTGYIICKYLIDHENITAEKAIELFESSRGHKMERDAYIKHLKTGELPESEEETYNEAGYSDFKPGNKRPNNFNDNGSAAKYARNDNWVEGTCTNRSYDSYKRGNSNQWEHNSCDSGYPRGSNSDNRYGHGYDNYSGYGGYSGNNRYNYRNDWGSSGGYTYDRRYDCDYDRYRDYTEPQYHNRSRYYGGNNDSYHTRNQHRHDNYNRDESYTSSHRDSRNDAEKSSRKRKHESPPPAAATGNNKDSDLKK